MHMLKLVLWIKLIAILFNKKGGGKMKKKFVCPQIKAVCNYRAAGGGANQSTTVACTVLPNQTGPSVCSIY